MFKKNITSPLYVRNLKLEFRSQPDLARLRLQRREFIKDNKKVRKQELDQESDQENKKTRNKTRT